MLSETGPSTSSAEQSRADDVDAQAVKLLGEGKRHLLVGDAPTAVTTLQEACEILAAKYGEVSDQCGDPYYHYGNALLELGRMESGVLGNALDGVPDGAATDTDDETEEPNPNIEKASKMQGDERKKVVQQVKEALETTYEQSIKKADGQEGVNGVAKAVNGEVEKGKGSEVVKEKKGEGESKEVKDEGKEKDAETEKVEGKEGEEETEETKQKKEVKDVCAGTTDMDGGVESTSATEEDDEITADDDTANDDTGNDDTGNDTAEDANKEENADDIPNFQLAWEMLELSRVIFSRKNDKEHKLKIAQVHFKLGELGLETEQYAQSLEDFSKCLDIQKSHLEPQSRLIAGSHYNLGLAFTFDSKMEKALKHFTEAKKIIEDRISKLEKDVTEKEEKKEENYEETVTKIKQEIKELQELIPDVVAKIEDAREGKVQPVVEGSSAFDKPSSSASTATTMQAVKVKRKCDSEAPSDISHLVKRKKMEEASKGTADSATTPKPEGDGDAKQVNGTPDSTSAKEEKKEAAMETA